jgi:hypothetical protein
MPARREDATAVRATIIKLGPGLMAPSASAPPIVATAVMFASIFFPRRKINKLQKLAAVATFAMYFSPQRDGLHLRAPACIIVNRQQLTFSVVRKRCMI